MKLRDDLQMVLVQIPLSGFVAAVGPLPSLAYFVAVCARNELCTRIRHHLHQIPETELEAQVSPHAQDDDLTIKVTTSNSSSEHRNPALAPLSIHPGAEAQGGR
jgi:hypothetical protein